ncbi:FHA domain-containing protein [Hyphomicrobium sp. NDB2Meth4]|uniref:FHA domain-containing protein n=1 Tax=Hyphomicrobium sp. NDB2Meth4 TaxID=1892846 RepID=UPI00093108BB|nr:FHA domain-containing protein [Hyphomicrobium sp. NDB2Meth4]
MTSPWSPLPNLSIATVAISQFSVATAAGASESGRAVSAGNFVVLASVAETWSQISTWLGEGYHKAPALMLVLAVLIALPLLAVAGLMLRRQRGSSDSTVLISRPSLRTGRRDKTARTELLSAWPTEAWVDLDGAKHIIGRTMLRVGREADNDICLQEKTVHRYHAVIRRTSDGEVIVTDLSGPEGNGVLVNGARVGEGRLKPGDVIAIGEVKLNFDARPI